MLVVEHLEVTCPVTCQVMDGQLVLYRKKKKSLIYIDEIIIMVIMIIITIVILLMMITLMKMIMMMMMMMKIVMALTVITLITLKETIFRVFYNLQCCATNRDKHTSSHDNSTV